MLDMIGFLKNVYFSMKKPDFEVRLHDAAVLAPMRLIKLLLVSTSLALAACSSLPTNVERTPSYALSDTSSTWLSQDLQPLLKEHAGLSGFHVLIDGVDAFATRLRLIHAAEKSIDAQYYIWHTDLTGNAMYNQLLHAADRGVRRPEHRHSLPDQHVVESADDRRPRRRGSTRGRRPFWR